jgi:hypothetical protein
VKQESKQDIILRLTEGLNAQQRSVPQLPAQAQARKIKVLGAKTDPRHPFAGYMVGADESADPVGDYVDEADFNPGRRGFLKKAGAVAATAAMPTGIAGAAAKAVAPAASWASTLSAPLAGLTAIDLDDIINLLMSQESKNPSYVNNAAYDPYDLDVIKKIAEDASLNSWGNSWFMNGNAAQALLEAIDLCEKKGMDDEDIIDHIFIVTKKQYMQELKQLSPEEVAKVKSQSLNPDNKSEPAASPTTGMSGLARAAGAQIGRTMKNVGKATATTVLNQPAKSAALPAPSVSPSMQIPKQKSRVAASPFNDDHSELDQFVKEEFNRHPDDLDEYADLEEGWKSKLAGAALAGAAAFGGGGAQANDQIAKDTQAITQAIQSGQMKSQEFAAGEIRPSQIYSHPKWLETVQAMNKKYPGNSEQARQAAITAIKQMIQQGNVREGAGTVGRNNPAAAWPDFGTAKTYESQLAEAKQRLVEAESRYVLYFNGKPASHYATEAEAKNIANAIKAKHPTVKIEIKNEMHEGKPQKRADRYHINKDGKPASLASYADKSSAVKDRDAKYPDAKVHQVGPRGKVKGEFEEGMAEGKWNYPPEYTKKANADDEDELGVSLINKDARKAWRKKQKAKAHKELMTGKNKEPGVSEGARVDRMVKHIASSEKATGKSKKDAESIAWATVNKRGYLDNKNKKKHVAEAGTPADIRAKNRAVVKKIQGKEVKEDITQEDIITKLKAKLGDYLSDLGQQIKKDPALQDKLSDKPPGDQVGPPVKTLTTDDGHEISIHGNEDDGFRISIKNKQTPSKFDSLDEAVMACEMYRAHRRKQALTADYVEEA